MTEILKKLEKFSTGEQALITKIAGRLMDEDKTLQMAEAIDRAIEEYQKK